MHLFNHEWDDKGQQVVINTQDMERAMYLMTVHKQLTEELSKVQTIIKEFEKRPNYRTIDILESYSGKPSGHSFFTFVDKRANALSEVGQERTSETYRVTARVFLAFVENPKLTFDEINQGLIKDFEEHLSARGLTRNTTSFYMRILRTIYKRGVMNGYTADKMPFRGVYAGIDKTEKRAVDETVIERLRDLVLDEPRLAFARDMFLFSFYTRGMSFVDMFYLKKENISEGVLIYKRVKTGQLLSIKIEQCMTDIIQRYAFHVRNSQYLFPLADATKGSLYSQHTNALRLQNQRLKRISDILQIKVPLTSYVSRHTWASIAKKKGISISIISEAMGHTSVTTTQIYLASFEQRVIDEANLSIISSGSGD